MRKSSVGPSLELVFMETLDKLPSGFTIASRALATTKLFFEVLNPVNLSYWPLLSRGALFAVLSLPSLPAAVTIK